MKTVFSRNSKAAEEKMIIIDCLESAFSVFINSLNSITHKIGYYKILKYFGEKYYEDEASHSSGIWLVGEKGKVQKKIILTKFNLFDLSL